METMIREFIAEVTSSEIFLLSLSIAMFYLATLALRRLRIKFLHPLIISALCVIFILRGLGIDYETYYEANDVLIFVLNISVVCMSYLLHKQIDRLSEYRLSLLLSTFVGSVVGILSIWALSTLFGCDEILIRSFMPKSVTTPIALNLCETIGGVPSITILSVIFAGILGGVVGPPILRLCRITDPVAVGAALGSASHALGTAQALSIGAVEGAVGSAAICLVGLFTAIVLPIFVALL